ncbi:hypothetical protein I3843_01G081500 [Carya illinoinensis]|nr:hypothetical protein I3843_01G081500 [Carya illinoinensis]
MKSTNRISPSLQLHPSHLVPLLGSCRVPTIFCKVYRLLPSTLYFAIPARSPIFDINQDFWGCMLISCEKEVNC